MPVNDTTTNQGYQKPNIANQLSDDVGRLRSALDSIDTDMAARLAKAGGVMTGPLGVTAGTAAAPSVYFTGDTNTGLYSPGADQVAISTNGTGRLFVNSSGNVGIGASSPGENLAVWGAASNPGVIGINSESGQVSRLQFKRANTNRFKIECDTSDNLLFYSDASTAERIRLDSFGRLLVGTSASVLTGTGTAGAVQISSAVGLVVRRNENITAGSPASITLGKSRNASDGSYTILQNSDDIGELRFAGDDGTDLQTQAAKILCQVDGTPGVNDMPGRLVFFTTASGAGSPTERARISSDGYLRMASGTGGIQFNGDTAATNALDDYEEGTFTPTVIGTTVAGTGTYSSQVGRYTKIGNTVRFQILLTWSAHTGTGNMRIAGLPFTNVNVTNAQSSASVAPSNLTFSDSLSAFTVQTTTQVYLRTYGTGGAEADLPIDTAASIRVAGVYEAA